MRRWLALGALVFALLLGWVLAGPWLAIDGIRKAVAENNSAALQRHVDFPQLRANLKVRADDYLAREAGPGFASSALGGLVLRGARGLAGGAIDTMATPAGFGALLEGRSLWHRASGGGIRADDAYAHVPPADPLADPKWRYESLARFTATVEPAAGAPVTLVFTRQGLRWRLTDIDPANPDQARAQ